MSKDIIAEFAASLGEGLFTDAAVQGALTDKRGEELIEGSVGYAQEWNVNHLQATDRLGVEHISRGYK